MAEEEEDKAKEAEGAGSGGKKKLIIIIAIALVVLVGIGGGAMMFLGSEEPEEEGEVEIVYKTIELGTFTVNLSESTSFLRVTLLAEYNTNLILGGSHGEGGGHAYGGGAAAPPAEPTGWPGLLGTREPMIKDAIIHVLSSKRTQEVLSLEGKEILKEELIDALNDAIDIDDAPIVNIYFLEFIIQ